ncbi:hypothetical protein [Actinacidiphila rubida]|uniref:Uncharacterized protein n=1 Tax=Actinacidiphila rubida TaxID=310780 RepID=A0A1H8LL46_9ACTN|nr:hypothetical protein [Actinacidiphila rubida]SEO05880.1 hypothetical protein SAMN05216267_101676 [Actinacidiphila rubida]
MSAASFLTGLYPPPVRERWGGEISREVAASGIRCWPDTVAGAARLWLHPTHWPEARAGQTRRVVVVALSAVTAATVLLLRSLIPTTTLTADVRHPATSLWLVPLLLGVLLAVPLPPLDRTLFARLVAAAARTLAAPAVAVAALLALAWSGAVRQATGPAEAALVAYYWLTLGFVAVRLCACVARAAALTTPPGTRRLSAAVLSVGAGLAAAAVQTLAALAASGGHPAAAAEGSALALAAVVTLAAGRDLGSLTA